jgi:hypothetical protein
VLESSVTGSIWFILNAAEGSKCVCNIPWFICRLCIATASAKTKERSKAKHQWKSRDLEAAILTAWSLRMLAHHYKALIWIRRDYSRWKDFGFHSNRKPGLRLADLERRRSTIKLGIEVYRGTRYDVVVVMVVVVVMGRPLNWPGRYVVGLDVC